jgi:GNAT superfamily N-acetyltransferase
MLVMPTFCTRNILEDSGRPVTVITILNDGNQQVGDAELSFDDPTTARLNDIYVLRDHRGKVLNYSPALLGKVFEEAKFQGATLLRCHPSPYERDLDEMRGAPPIENCTWCIPVAKLIAWYVAEGFKEVNEDSDEFWQHHCRLYINL